MAELSPTRSNFYKQVYFPSTYYKQVFDVTLEEAGDLKKAQDELEKLLLNASGNLTRLYAEVRPSKLNPQALREVEEARLKIEEYDKTQGKSKDFASSLRKNPVAALKLGELIDASKVGPEGTTASAFDSSTRFLAGLEREAKKYSANPDLAQKILAEGITAARNSGINFDANPGALNNAVKRIAGSEATLASVEARVKSPEGQAGVDKFRGGTK